MLPTASQRPISIEANSGKDNIYLFILLLPNNEVTELPDMAFLYGESL